MNDLFEKYWALRMQSVTARLEAARSVIVDHNLTRGIAAESVLRSLLRELLPQKCGIGGGFILTKDGESSRQLDIIVFDQLTSAPLYQDGDLVILSPDSVYVAIEVKTNLTREELTGAFENIASIKKHNKDASGLVFGYWSATIDTIQDCLIDMKNRYVGNFDQIPNQIYCLERKLFIAWDKDKYHCYELESGIAQQLVNQVLSAGEVNNLVPYLADITGLSPKFTV